MFVLDDGWFGKRNSDNCSLGDWYVDKEKLPGGLKSLVDAVKDYGMGFGLCSALLQELISCVKMNALNISK